MGSAVIFSGSDVKTLKSNIDIGGAAKILTGTADPTSSAQSAPVGSVYLNTSTGTIYRKLDAGSSTNWLPLGSDSAAGLNFIGLNSSFQPVNTTDRNAEVSVGNWVAYDDGAATQPVDLTGGSPASVSIARTTTAAEVLNASGSFKITKAAANAQGQGVSVVANVPIGYRGQTLTFSMAWKLVSGSLASGDLKVFVYDVTNSTLIVPFNNEILGNYGLLSCTFPVPTTTAQIRIGFHFGTTVTNAATVSFDDVKCAVDASLVGSFISEWVQDNTFTATGFGTISSPNFWRRRVGDSMQVKGNFVTGTVTAVSAFINLPSGYVIDNLKYSSSGVGQKVGEFYTLPSGGINTPSTTTGPFPIAYDGTITSGVYVSTSMSSAFSKTNATSVTGNTTTVDFNFTVAISGWGTNVTMGASSTYKMSNYLSSSGARVTGTAPTKLGEYRSYLRNSSAATYTETSGNPVTVPTIADGIKLWNSGLFSTGDPSNNPSRYEIFVGANKNVKAVFYASAARTGFVDVTPTQSGTTALGYVTNYDPSTGIFSIAGNTLPSSVSALKAGADNTGGAFVAGPIFFDIIVSENALQVGIQAPRSYVLLSVGNGHGSTNTKVRRFSTILQNVGSAIGYSDSATLGATITIQEQGIFTITYSDVLSSGAADAGISLNSSQLTTAISAITDANILAISTSGAGNATTNCAVTTYLNVGDIVRPHTGGTVNGTTVYPRFSIVKVSN